jgi:hypothetical protein
MQRLGGQGGAISRANYQELMTAINNINTQVKSDTTMTSYVALGNYLANPTFSAGSLVPTTQTSTGRTIYGTPNVRLFQ